MLAIRIEKELEEELNKTKTDLVKEQLKAINFLLSNPIKTDIEDLKAIQKVKNKVILRK